MDQTARITLVNEKQWRQFHALPTEMIITKKGRRMYPRLEYKVEGLYPDCLYRAYLFIERADTFRYKWMAQSGWVSSGPGEPIQHATRIRLDDEDVPQTGRQLMEQPFVFDRFKMTNNVQEYEKNPDYLVYMLSMHKYIPVVRIFMEHPMGYGNAPNQPISEIRTEIATFFAVTCYQNTRVTQMKIENNKFAKGFREGRRKRSSTPTSDEVDDHSPKQKRCTPTDSVGLHAVKQECSPTVRPPHPHRDFPMTPNTVMSHLAPPGYASQQLPFYSYNMYNIGSSYPFFSQFMHPNPPAMTDPCSDTHLQDHPQQSHAQQPPFGYHDAAWNGWFMPSHSAPTML